MHVCGCAQVVDWVSTRMQSEEHNQPEAAVAEGVSSAARAAAERTFANENMRRRADRGGVRAAEEPPDSNDQQIEDPPDDAKDQEVAGADCADDGAVESPRMARMRYKMKKRSDRERGWRMQTLISRPNPCRDDFDDHAEVQTGNMALDLANYAVLKGSMDNISVVIITLENARASVAYPTSSTNALPKHGLLAVSPPTASVSTSSSDVHRGREAVGDHAHPSGATSPSDDKR